MKGAIPITSNADKFVGYMSVTPNKKFMKLFERANVQNILISYHYIQKDLHYTKDILQIIRDRGGLFMTDSGIFSFVNDKSFDHKKFGWQAYLEKYVDWLTQYKEYVFSACNLDADMYVLPDDVRRWNEDYFEPLGCDINMIYVAHKNSRQRGDLDAFREYADKYRYVGVNESMKDHASAIYQYAKKKNVAVHGLAWTKPSVLNDFPFFSVDSSTWVNYQKYGATPVWDGTNFQQYDKDNKDIRKTLKTNCQAYGVKFYEFCNEKNEADGTHNDDEGLTFSLRTWLDVFQHLKGRVRPKLDITVQQLLKGKVTVFNESPMVGQPAAGQKKSMADQLSDRDDVGEVRENGTIEYKEDDEGDLVPVYNKREKISITQAMNAVGDALMCDNCVVGIKCPKYKPSSTCAFDFSTPENNNGPLALIDFMINAQMARVNRAMFIESMEGGMTNKVFTKEIETLNMLNNTKVHMMIMARSKGVILSSNGTSMAIMDNTDTLPSGEQPPAVEGPKTGGFLATFAELMKQQNGNKK